VITTKTGLEWRDGKVYRNASRARILREVDDSLRRLRTDYIDIYLVHWPDPLVPVEETAEAMRLLYEQGKIRAIGVSNFSVAQMERFRQASLRCTCWSRPTTCSSAPSSRKFCLTAVPTTSRRSAMERSAAAC
jgi:aryl-alcohol dehydrogenase-like predicted oxidoreductase